MGSNVLRPKNGFRVSCRALCMKARIRYTRRWSTDMTSCVVFESGSAGDFVRFRRRPSSGPWDAWPPGCEAAAAGQGRPRPESLAAGSLWLRRRQRRLTFKLGGTGPGPSIRPCRSRSRRDLPAPKEHRGVGGAATAKGSEAVIALRSGPTHGQQLSLFNHFYDTACYLPLVLTFDNEREQ